MDENADNESFLTTDVGELVQNANSEADRAVLVYQAVDEIEESLKSEPELIHSLKKHESLLELTVDPELAPEYRDALESVHELKLMESGLIEGLWVAQKVSSGAVLYIRKDEPTTVHCEPPSEPVHSSCLQLDEIQGCIQKINEDAEASRQDQKMLDDYYNSQVPQIIKTQAQVRMWQARRNYLNQMKETKDRKEAEKKEYEKLTQSDAPALGTVRRFATYIVQTELDYEEELEIQKMETSVAQAVRANEDLERDLHVMDLKIGLLVKNYVDIDDVIRHGQRLKSHDRRDSSPEKLGNRPRALSRASQSRLELYEAFVYLLQTEPKYLARLLFAMDTNNRSRLVDYVLFPLFNYAAHRREEYLLLCFLKTALVLELQRNVGSLSDVSDMELQVPRIAVALNRSADCEEGLKNALGPLVDALLGEDALHVNVDPLEIYEYLVETPPKEMTAEEAAEHPQVKQVLTQSMDYLAHWADAFQDAIVRSPAHIPYFIRYLGKVMRSSLEQQFESAQDKEIIKAVAHIIYDSYFRHAVAAPDSFGAIDPSREITTEQRKKLGSIAKLLQFATMNKGFGEENAYLSPLNSSISKMHERFKRFLLEVVEVREPEEVFGVDQYSDYTLAREPTVTLLVADLLFLQQNAVENRRKLIQDAADDLGDVLDEFGPDSPEAVHVAALFIENVDNVSNPGQTEAQLHLKSRKKIQFQDDALQNRQVFVQTKKLVLDLILSGQNGETLPEMLSHPTTHEAEVRHLQLQKESQSRRAVDAKIFSLGETKSRIAENLAYLEDRGLTSRKNDYQSIISAIAQDIQTENKFRDRRKLEKERLKRILKELEEKRKYQREQIFYYNQYIQGCLENLDPKLKRRSIRLDSESGNKRTSALAAVKPVKKTADKLAKKGLVREVLAIPENQLKNVTLEFSSGDRAGIFEVETKFPNQEPERGELVLQELLKLQYEGAQAVTVGGKVVMHLDALIHFLNKKFYCS